MLIMQCDIIALVLPTTSVQEHAGNDKSCVWHAADFSDGELKDELFCIRFGSVDSKLKFNFCQMCLIWIFCSVNVIM